MGGYTGCARSVYVCVSTVVLLANAVLGPVRDVVAVILLLSMCMISAAEEQQLALVHSVRCFLRLSLVDCKLLLCVYVCVCVCVCVLDCLVAFSLSR